MTQRGMPQKLHGLAREIVHIHEQVGMNRWRLAAGRVRDGFEPVPRVELPDWSTADANSLVNTFAVTRAPKVNVRHPVVHTTHHARTYELTERGVRVARQIVDGSGSMLPCGHRGICNPRGVDGLTCQHDGCEAVFSRDEVQR